MGRKKYPPDRNTRDAFDDPQSCETCIYYWTSSTKTQCHKREARERDEESGGIYCPWWEGKPEPDEQNEPVDIWN